MTTQEQALRMANKDQQWVWNILRKHRLPSKTGRIGLSFCVVASLYAKLANCISVSMRHNITLVS
jgi:hypothetical protein